MTPIVVDFETYFAKGYTLSSMTTEEYVRDPKFETILCGFKIADEPAYWVDRDDVPHALKELSLHKHAVIAHHAHFDGLILNHHYDIRPRMWIDTLSMARARRGSRVRNGLAFLSEQYGIGVKGDDTKWAFGKRRADFSPREIKQYGAYCCNDCDLEYRLATRFTPKFVVEELRIIDNVVRAFTEPMLWLHPAKLQRYVEQLRSEKLSLLMQAGIQLDQVMSAEKFAEALRRRGVRPPTKISPRTGKLTYAFAKSDEAMKELAEHDDIVVQLLVAARLKNKSTIDESRALRMISMAGRGAACVYYNYSGAGTSHRLSGGDKMNWQNFRRGGLLRDAIYAPEGKLCLVGDSSNIESRTEDWLAGQDDVVEKYRLYDSTAHLPGDDPRRHPDIYCVMAEMIYDRKINAKKDRDERQMGKVTKLGLGYGMGAAKFVFAVRAQTGKKIKLEFAKDVVDIYRSTHNRVMNLHKRGTSALEAIAAGRRGVPVDFRGIVTTCKDGVRLPNGMIIKYTGLRHPTDENGVTLWREWEYWDGRAWTKIYGGKVIENIVQALARIIVFYQLLKVGLPFKLSSHDEGVFVVPEGEALHWKKVVENALRTPLDWCPDLPLNCEVGFHRVYGKAKK